MTNFPTLDQVLGYKNSSVCQRYQKDYPQNALAAEQALAELIKYLWLGQKQAHDQKSHPEDESLYFMCAMHAEMKEIDDMWHTFLLFTRDYEVFCKTYFEVFIHHIPTTEDADMPKDYEMDLTRYLSYAYDHLGEETLCLWFAEQCGND